MQSTDRPPRIFVVTFVYFAVVFCAGLAFRVIVFAVPLAVGASAAELIEAPFLLVVIVVAALIVARRYTGDRFDLAAMGVLAAFLMLIADVLVGVVVRGVSPYEMLFGRDAVTGWVYYGRLAAFAAMPYLLWRDRDHAPPGDSQRGRG